MPVVESVMPVDDDPMLEPVPVPVVDDDEPMLDPVAVPVVPIELEPVPVPDVPIELEPVPVPDVPIELEPEPIVPLVVPVVPDPVMPLDVPLRVVPLVAPVEPEPLCVCVALPWLSARGLLPAVEPVLGDIVLGELPVLGVMVELDDEPVVGCEP